MLMWYFVIGFLEICWNSSSITADNSFNEIYQNEQQIQLLRDSFLPRDRQISVSLQAGLIKKYYYWSEVLDHPLSIIITPCNSDFFWSITFQSNHTFVILKNESVSEPKYHFIDKSQKGFYVVDLVSMRNSSVFVYINTEVDGPQILLNSNQKFLQVVTKHEKKKLLVKWNQSLVDPHVTEYYIVISTKKNYTNLCSAFYDKYFSDNMFSETSTFESPSILSPLNNSNYELGDKDLVIFWTGCRTKIVIINFNSLREYFLNVYAVNKQTNFSYLYGSKLVQKGNNVIAKSLKDGALEVIYAKKMHDNKAVYKFKIKKDTDASVDFMRIFLTPCSTTVKLEVTQNGKKIVQQNHIREFDQILIKNPKSGQRFYLKLTILNRENLKSYSKIELLVTARNLSSMSLFSLPNDLRLHEYSSTRTCNSTTVGWKTTTSIGSNFTQYCIVLRDGFLHQYLDMLSYYSCHKTDQTIDDQNYLSKACYVNFDKRRVMTYRITDMKPMRSYVVQVIMKTSSGKLTSYHLLQIQTKSKCNNDYNRQLIN